MATPDPFKGLAGEAQMQPANRGFAITPTNGGDLVAVTRGLWVGTGGNLNLTLASGDAVLLKNVQAGTILPLRVAQVQATSTTASDIVGLY